MRKGLLRTIQPPPGPVTGDLLARMQSNIAEAFEAVASDHDVISSPAVRLVASGAIPAGTAVAVFTGAAGCTLTLPLANAQGSSVAAVLYVANTSTNALTVQPSGADSINGGTSLTVAAGTVGALVSDGATRWSTPSSGSAGITGLSGDVIAGPGTGVVTAAIGTNVIVNSDLAQAPAKTMKGNNTGAPANVADLTPAQIAVLLANGAAAGKVLNGSGIFDYAKTVRGLRIADHSYSDIQQGGSNPAIATSDYTWYKILTGALGLDDARVFNHSSAGTQITTSGNAGYSWTTAMSAILATKSQSQVYPAVSYGECFLLGYGINDISQNTVANQTKIRADIVRCKRTLISAHRAAAWFPCNGSSSWTFGANFSNSTNTDATIGTAKQASVVDSAGSSTATFTIPAGYRGETICFPLLALSGGSLIVTWGGTVTGTTGIIGRTDTLSGLTVNAQCSYPVRFTTAACGLTAANAGQTITVRITTVSASTFTIEGAIIEAQEPAPVILMTQPRLPEKTISFQFGDAVLSNGSTSITSANAAQFSSATDAGQAIVVSDGGGGLQANTTIASVTNATTAVLSLAANASRPVTAPAKVTLTRKIKGYSGIGALNNDFLTATPASHSAADADVTNMNADLVSLKAEFGAKVVVADLDPVLGGDLNPPTGFYSWFETGGLHLNELGQRMMAKIVYDAIGTLGQESSADDGALVTSGGASRFFRPMVSPVRSNIVITTPFTSFGASYTCVVGDVFAQWIQITDPTTQLASVIAQQTNAPATSGSTVRTAFYSDVNCMGYPDVIINDMGTFALGTTAGVKTLATNTHVLRPGYYWFCMRVESLGTTASQLQIVNGPQAYGPLGMWQSGGGTTAPLCHKLTGQATGSAFPNRFYTSGASIVSNAPLLGMVVTRL